ncbi:TPA: YeaH/YhbH family protein [Vibrio cholerae]|nr:YeaH/YhbH family protein [Vibrio cholerae]
MAQFIDRRLNGKNKSTVNRQRFLRRYKEQIKESVADAVNRRSITNTESGEDVSIPTRDIKEPMFHQGKGGVRERVHPGNDQFIRGDKIDRPKGGQGSGGSGEGEASADGEGSDDFVFQISKDEYLDILFEDLALPNLKKNQVNKITEWKTHRAGFQTSGVPSNISVVRSLQQSLARRTAMTAGKRRLMSELEEELERQATKDIAKRFYVLLYLFLTRTYENVEVVFIRHHTQAKEVNEHDFFYSQETGGTIVSSALKLMHEIIEARYPLGEWNIYGAQASDGDNWADDSPRCKELLSNKLLPYCQYYAYIEITRRSHQTLWHEYEKLQASFDNFAMKNIRSVEDIFPVFRELFQKENA